MKGVVAIPVLLKAIVFATVPADSGVMPESIAAPILTFGSESVRKPPSKTSIPAPVFPSGLFPSICVPMRLPWTTTSITLAVVVPMTMPSPLPEMTLPAPEIVPPTVISLLSMPIPAPRLPRADVPARSVPIRLPSIRVPSAAPYEIKPGKRIARDEVALAGLRAADQVVRRID